MKTNFKLFILIFSLAFFAIGCEEEETGSSVNYLTFETDALQLDLEIGASASGEIVVYTGNTSGSSRTFDIVVDQDGTSAPAGSYSIPSTVTIPGDSNSAVLEFDVTDNGFDITGGSILLKFADNQGISLGSDLEITVAITCEVPLVIDINFDNYGSETSWDIVDASGTTLYSGGGYSDGQASFSRSVCLANGTFDFIIYDVYSDGICCNYGNGDYTLSYGGTVLVSGGSFGASETTAFTIN